MTIQPGEQFKARGIMVWIEGDTIMLKYKAIYYGSLGTKRVPVSNITAINWKEPSIWLAGFLELTILGENRVLAHTSPTGESQNRIVFNYRDRLKFATLRDWIQERIGKPVASASIADELTKLVMLLKDGFITQEEFDTQKKKLLGS